MCGCVFFAAALLSVVFEGSPTLGTALLDKMTACSGFGVWLEEDAS